MGPAALEAHNPNNVGGDISGGAHTGLQLIARPVFSMDPYFTGSKGIYLCSSSTHPVPVSTACAVTGPPAPRCGDLR